MLRTGRSPNATVIAVEIRNATELLQELGGATLNLEASFPPPPPTFRVGEWGPEIV